MTERKDLVLSIEAQETTDKKVAQSDQILPETNAGIGDPGSSLQSTFSSGELIAGRFKIIRFIARGGMGEVYEAEDLELRERVALKTIRSKVEQNKKAMEHFRREIQIARKVTHPNVCRTFDLFHHKSGEIDITFLTMELLRGESLTARLGRSGKMTTVEAFPIVQQMADALTAAHKAGIIHRDFKSPNVVLVPIQGNEEEVRVVVTVCEVLLHDGKVTTLIPDVPTFMVRLTPDERAIQYVIAGEGVMTVYRQDWKDGVVTGEPKVALKLPVTFPMLFHGNAYDVSRDLSTVVYARPGGHADLYFLPYAKDK